MVGESESYRRADILVRFDEALELESPRGFPAGEDVRSSHGDGWRWASLGPVGVPALPGGRAFRRPAMVPDADA